MLHEKSMRVLTLMLLSSLAGLNGAYGATAGGLDIEFSLDDKPVTVEVSGKVVYKETGQPIPQALVRGHIVIWNYQGPDLFEKCPYQETRTDAQGTYQLQFVTVLTTSGPMKEHDGLCVYVSAPGYESVPQYARPNVTTDHTRYVDFDFKLERGQLIHGTVVDEDAKSVEGATVRFMGGMNGDWDFFGAAGKAATDADGHFELWVGKEWGRWLTIRKNQYGTAFVWDALEQGDLKTVVLRRGGDIAGTVVDPRGKGVADCEVSVRNMGHDLIDKVRTDSEGNYLLRGVPGDPTLIDFYKTKNGTYRQEWGKSTVYARVDPQMNLAIVPQYEILAQEGKAVTGPVLTVGADTSVSGKLIATDATYSIDGLLVRLDYRWENMVEAGVDGSFRFPFVSLGKHRLTAYLPHNLRYDRGIGQAEIEVKGQPIEDVQIQLEPLAELRVQCLDASGNPMAGITAGATWSINGDGAWTQGTRSDKDGWAVLYLYPDEVQYVRGFDLSGTLVAETFKKVEPREGEILGSVRVVMVPSAGFKGRIVDQDGTPIAKKTVVCHLDFGGNLRWDRGAATDAEGRFRLEDVVPGVVRLSLEVDSTLFNDVISPPFELKPGETKDLGRIALKDGAMAPSNSQSTIKGR